MSTVAQIAAIQATVATLSSQLDALPITPDVNPLQAELDAANEQLAQRTAELADAQSINASLSAKMAAAAERLQARKVADAAEDAASDEALALLTQQG